MNIKTLAGMVILILALVFGFRVSSVGALSSSYDGIWEGYAYSSEGRFYINMEIKNGIMSGFVEDTKVKGYINADNNLFTSPFYFKNIGAIRVIPETNFMSPDRIEGIYRTQARRFKWFVVKPATAKSDITTANVKVNEKEPWTGKWKVESTSQGRGIWAMKQEGEIVKSTRESLYEFKGKVQGNRLKGKMVWASNTYDPFIIEMLSDSMSFKGTLELVGRTYHLKGKRIE